MAQPALLATVDSLLHAVEQPGLDSKQSDALVRELSATLGEEDYLVLLEAQRTGPPKAIRLNLPQISAAVVGVVGGYAQGGILGAAAGLAAVWSFSETKSELPPHAAVVVAVLVAAPEQTLLRSDLEASYAKALSDLKVSGNTDTLEAVLQTLALNQVVGLQGDEVTLRECVLSI